MSRIIPTIELENGSKYEIKRNRYILAEMDKMREESDISPEDNQNYAILQDKYASLKKLAERVKELEDKYFESFSDEAQSIYERAKAHYDKVYADTVAFEASTKGVANKIQRETINKVEELVIRALQLNENGDEIRARAEATEIWCTFVDEVGHETAKEWLLYAFNYLSGNDGANDNDPFIKEQKAKAEQKANMRKGILKAR